MVEGTSDKNPKSFEVPIYAARYNEFGSYKERLTGTHSIMKGDNFYLLCNLCRILRTNTEQDEERPDWLQISRITRTKGVSFTFDWIAPGIYLKFKMKENQSIRYIMFFFDNETCIKHIPAYQADPKSLCNSDLLLPTFPVNQTHLYIRRQLLKS